MLASTGRIVVISLMALIPLYASSAPTPGQLKYVTRHYDFAMQALKSGNFKKAQKYLDRAVEIFPVFPEAHIGLGQIAMQEGRFVEALAEFRRASDGYGEMGSAMFDLRLKRFVEAQDQIVALRDEIKKYQGPLAASLPPGAVARAILGLETRIRNLEAINAPTREPDIEPPGEVYFYMGNALYRLERLEEALEAWETCSSKSRKFPLVHNNLAVGYWMKGEFERARQSLDRAEALGMPVNAEFRSDLESSAAKFTRELTVSQP